jgi:hypothetical protein
MAKEQDHQAREEKIKANRRESVDKAKKQAVIPAKKSREDVNQAAFRIVKEATERD